MLHGRLHFPAKGSGTAVTAPFISKESGCPQHHHAGKGRGLAGYTDRLGNGTDTAQLPEKRDRFPSQ